MRDLLNEYLEYLGDKFYIESIRERFKITFAQFVEIHRKGKWDEYLKNHDK